MLERERERKKERNAIECEYNMHHNFCQHRSTVHGPDYVVISRCIVRPNAGVWCIGLFLSIYHTPLTCQTLPEPRAAWHGLFHMAFKHCDTCNKQEMDDGGSSRRAPGRQRKRQHKHESPNRWSGRSISLRIVVKRKANCATAWHFQQIYILDTQKEGESWVRYITVGRCVG